jgi:hypothetical protein
MVASAIVTWPSRWVGLLSLMPLGSCVPNDPPPGAHPGAAPISTPAVTLQRWRPHSAAPAMPEPQANRTVEPNRPNAVPTEDLLLVAKFHDEFERESLGTDWMATSDNWRIEGGRLCGQSNRNHPIWLKRRIPDNARITFSARALSTNGDLKAEVWGNGRSFAKGTSYDDATSYVFVLGGWKNQLHVMARLNEHDPQRLALRVDPTGEDRRLAPVLPNVDYQFTIERRDSKTLVWRVNAVELFVFEDKEPLVGQEHDHFGFNNWESPVCFDDLTITPLPE